jgi:hypothetical protein
MSRFDVQGAPLDSPLEQAHPDPASIARPPGATKATALRPGIIQIGRPGVMKGREGGERDEAALSLWLCAPASRVRDRNVFLVEFR